MDGWMRWIDVIGNADGDADTRRRANAERTAPHDANPVGYRYEVKNEHGRRNAGT